MYDKISKNMPKCLVCQKEVNRIELHIRCHNLSKKEYYDQFLKKDTDGLCLLCGKQTKFTSLSGGYKEYCSVKCAKRHQFKDPEYLQAMLDKKKKTNLEKYGVEYPMQCEIGHNNFKQAIIDKYGVESYSQTDEYKEKCKHTCLEKYGADHFCKSQEGKDKLKSKCLEKFGVENVFQAEWCKEKMKQTNLEKYGVENYAQTKEHREKCKKTMLEKYGDENYNNIEQIKKTTLDRYGVEDIIKSPEIQEKIKETKKQNKIDYIFNNEELNKFVTPQFLATDFTDIYQLYSFKCNKCNTIFDDEIHGKTFIPKCPICFKNNNISNMERDFLDYLKIPDTDENRQIMLEGFKLDAKVNNKIFEFLGDYFHGNPLLFKPEEYNKKCHTTHGELFEKTKIKLYKLQNLGFIVYYMWEDDWIKWLKGKIKTFPLKNLKYHPM